MPEPFQIVTALPIGANHLAALESASPEWAFTECDTVTPGTAPPAQCAKSGALGNQRSTFHIIPWDRVAQRRPRAC